MSWLVKTAFASDDLLARIVPLCDPSNTNSNADIPDCDLNQLLLMGQNIVNFLISAAFIITVLFIVIGAFRMIVSGGNEKALSSAKANITSAIFGLVIVLVSWVVLNTAISVFKSDACTGDWWKFDSLMCGEYIQSGSLERDSGKFYCGWTGSGCTIDTTRINCSEGFTTREEQCASLNSADSCSSASFSCRASAGVERPRNR